VEIGEETLQNRLKKEKRRLGTEGAVGVPPFPRNSSSDKEVAMNFGKEDSGGNERDKGVRVCYQTCTLFPSFIFIFLKSN
jgi:hypothetical protein